MRTPRRSTSPCATATRSARSRRSPTPRRANSHRGRCAICSGAGKQPYQYKVTIARKVQEHLRRDLRHRRDDRARDGDGRVPEAALDGQPVEPVRQRPRHDVSGRSTRDPPQATYPNFWANIAGGNSTKPNGDALRRRADVQHVTDGCTGSGNGTNINYTRTATTTRSTSPATGTVDLQAFDPAFMNVGDFCTDGSTNLAGRGRAHATSRTTRRAPPTPPTSASGTRPVTDSGNQQRPGLQYCTGDILFDSGPAADHDYTVLKASVPGRPRDRHEVCSPKTYPGYTGDVVGPLGAGGNRRPAAPTGSRRISASGTPLPGERVEAGDEYFIQVRPTTAARAQPVLAARGRPRRQRRGAGDIAGNTYMGIYANVGGGQTTQFYLARVPTAAAGHTLVLNFFDIGDAHGDRVRSRSCRRPTATSARRSPNCKWTRRQRLRRVGLRAPTPVGALGSDGRDPRLQDHRREQRPARRGTGSGAR